MAGPDVPDVGGSKKTGNDAGNDAIAGQKELTLWSLKMNLAIAWLTTAKDIAGKIR